MAGKNVNRGFAGYLLILLLMVIAAFLITVVVMFLSPFKPILGYEYISYEKVYDIDKETTALEGDDKINFTSLKEIDIDCGYAEVSVGRNSKIDHPVVRITNNVVGFAKESQDTRLLYKVYYTDNTKQVVKIETKEPDAFLYLNKKVKIELLVPKHFETSFNNTKISIVNNSGSVYLGNKIEIQEGYTDITFKSLSIKTASGSVVFNPFTKTTYNDLFIKTENGSVTSNVNLDVNNSLYISSQSGKVALKNLSILGSEDIKLDLKDSKFEANLINGNVDFNIKDGYFTVGKISGYLISNNATEQIGSARITINELEGHISLPYANNAVIKIKQMTPGSQAYINGLKSSVQIDDVNGLAIIKTTNGNIDVHSSGGDLTIETETGKVNVVYEANEIDNALNFVSKTGQIDLKIKGNLKFVATFKNCKGVNRTSTDISIARYDSNFKNPLVVNDGTKPINFTSDGKINISLI